MKQRLWIASSLFITVVLIDQLTKIYVKTHFIIGESVDVFSWFKILFIENEGAAWGVKIPGSWGKLALSLFRIAAIVFISIWVYRQTKRKSSLPTLLFSTLILAGAIGNIIDSAFYGLIFSESDYMPASAFKGGYAPLFYGKVVDMISFPLIDTVLPDWLPVFGGKPFRFFEYVFNISDAAITVGGAGLLFVFKKKPKTT